MYFEILFKSQFQHTCIEHTDRFQNDVSENVLADQSPGSVLQCVAVCCSALQCVAVRCSALQCVAVCCSVYTDRFQNDISENMRADRSQYTNPFGVIAVTSF